MRDALRGVDPSCGDEQEAAMLGCVAGDDGVGRARDPEVTLDGAVGGERGIDEHAHALVDVDVAALLEVVEASTQRSEDEVAGLHAEVPQVRGDGHALVLFGDVADDAEEVSSVDTFGKRVVRALAGEDGDALDDAVEWIARDGVLQLVLGVVEGELAEGVVEEATCGRILPCARGVSRTALLACASDERLAGARDVLLRRCGVAIELEARPAIAASTRSMVERACAGAGLQLEHLPGALALGGRVDEDRRSDLGEEAEGALDVRLVLRPRDRRAHADGVADARVDLGCGVAGLVVEQQRDGRCTGGGDAVVEGSDDGRGVLVRADVDADGGGGVGVDAKLEVEDEEFALEGDADGRAVTGPLRAGEEGRKRVAQRVLVGRASATTRWEALAGELQDRGEGRTSDADVVVALDLIAEDREGASPAAPRVEHRLQVKVAQRCGVRLGLGLGRGIVDRCRRSVGHRQRARTGATPLSQRRHRHADRVGNHVGVEVGVALAQLDREAPEAVAVPVPRAVATDGTGMIDHVPQRLARELGGDIGRRRGELGWATRCAFERRQAREHAVAYLVGRAARGLGRRREHGRGRGVR
ncbi:MAG: hypothetical protein K1X88_09570 [Nannocystaceae bacterium]|nr:hypothetical protein [Nannocystaceae bacterium]